MEDDMASVRLAVVAAACAALAAPALAHEGGLDARGEVVEVSDTRLVVKTPEGETKTFSITPGTEVRRGKSPAKISDVTAGEKAVVHAKKSERGEPEAISIRLARDAPGKK
jgi:hypothetical protein